MSANGQLVFTDVDKVTFKGVGNTSNAVIDTLTGKIGVGVDSPSANLHVVGNCFVSTNFELGGTMTMGTVTVEAQHELSAITATGNVTPHTIQFTNPTTAFTTTGNVSVGGDISISSNLKMNDVVFINATGANMVAIGNGAGTTSQAADGVAIGHDAATTSQGTKSVAIGNLTATTSQGTRSVAVGYAAGWNTQGDNAVAIGNHAAQNTQGYGTVTVGYKSGQQSQGAQAVAIGMEAGNSGQTSNAVAIGFESGKTNQGASAVAVGHKAGETNQGDNSIILNATGVALDSTTASSFHVKPVRGGNYAASALAYTSTGEIVEETNMHFDTAGNVGIGTTSPDYTLDVNGTLGQNGKELYAQRRWEIDLTAQSNAIFYPIEFKHPFLEGTPDLPDMYPVHFKVFGESLGGSDPYNENTLVGYAQGGGWSDHGPMYDVHVERHSAGEHRFQGLYEGNSGYRHGFVIYMRGGYRYSTLTDASDVVTHTTTLDYTEDSNNTKFALKNVSGTDVSGTSLNITQLVNIAGSSGEQRWMSGSINITQLGPIYNIPKTRAQIFELSTGSKYYDTTGFQDYTGYGAAWTAYSANPLYSISITGDYVNGTGGEINYRVVVENQSTSALSYFPNSTGFRKFHYVDHNRLDGHGYHGIMSGLTPGTSYKCKLQVIPTANASGTNNYNWNSLYGTITGIAWD